MDDQEPRRDLAAMLQPLVQALIAAERPVLARHGLTMWGYIVLSALDDAPESTQGALSLRIGADKTRIIPTLDELQEAGLIARVPDPADRRARVLSITPAGRQVRDGTRREIQRGEERLLARLTAAERQAFLHAADLLSSLPVTEIAGG
jgi:DNA-binding MarR family transcriptional regulator